MTVHAAYAGPRATFTDAELNDIESRIEERARDEAENRKGPFDEFVGDCDTDELAFIVASLFAGTPDSCERAQEYASRICKDYIEWRVNDPGLREQVEREYVEIREQENEE